MNSDQTNSDNSSPDKSLEFRRCWALGEAYYFLENNYEDCFRCNMDLNPDSKDIRDYRGQLRSIDSICNELKINDPKIDEFLRSLHNKLDTVSNKNNSFEHKKHEGELGECFEVKLEGYIIGNLIGKDPRYNHIFRTAKHTSELYHIKDPKENPNYDQEIHNIETDLESIKNFVSEDKITLIHEIIENWTKVCGNYRKYKMDDIKSENESLNSEYAKHKPPYLIEIVNKIGGLITGSIDVYGVLNRRDRSVWAVVSYGSFIFPAIFIGVILWWFNLHFSFVNQIVLLTNGEKLSNYLIALSAIAGIFLAIIKSSKPLWQKFADWFTLKLAIKRIKDPSQYVIISPWQIFEKDTSSTDLTKPNERAK